MQSYVPSSKHAIKEVYIATTYARPSDKTTIQLHKSNSFEMHMHPHSARPGHTQVRAPACLWRDRASTHTHNDLACLAYIQTLGSQGARASMYAATHAGTVQTHASRTDLRKHTQEHDFGPCSLSSQSRFLHPYA